MPPMIQRQGRGWAKERVIWQRRCILVSFLSFLSPQVRPTHATLGVLRKPGPRVGPFPFSEPRVKQTMGATSPRGAFPPDGDCSNQVEGCRLTITSPMLFLEKCGMDFCIFFLNLESLKQVTSRSVSALWPTHKMQREAMWREVNDLSTMGTELRWDRRGSLISANANRQNFWLKKNK